MNIDEINTRIVLTEKCQAYFFKLGDNDVCMEHCVIGSFAKETNSVGIGSFSCMNNCKHRIQVDGDSDFIMCKKNIRSFKNQD